MADPYKIEIAAARKALKALGVQTLLTAPTSNPKVAKNGKLGALTAVLHLAPYDLSGYQVCPMASKGCAAGCLHTAGNPIYMKAKKKARIAKTRAYFTNRHAFMKVLQHEIAALERKAKREGMLASIRLNATSDIAWEGVSVTVLGHRYRNVMELFSDVQFYDYTKRHNRRRIPANYHLTFSLSEDNDTFAAGVLKERKMRVAVVFDTKRNRPLPKLHIIAGRASRVIDGDEHDFRPSDKGGWIVGLRAKGDAIGDTSGFVRAA